MTPTEHARSLLMDRARAALDALPDYDLPEVVEWLEDRLTWHRQIVATVQREIKGLLQAGAGGETTRANSPIEQKTYTVLGAPWRIP